ncbi:AbrB/MazE/SpoVT family DNA-binding domain-containing protein [Candidatus Pacearchaeota archaeon]|nr:AbrB/MazE/SpoVT family DNA-binding domain-containing protein [Candidatus Pacearchaeota archaeon]
MAEIGITKMSSKGQVVIPQEMRKDIKEGDKLLIIQGEGKLILKKATQLDENFQEDLEFARRTEEAYKRIEAGEYLSYSKEEFLKKLEKW